MSPGQSAVELGRERCPDPLLILSRGGPRFCRSGRTMWHRFSRPTVLAKDPRGLSGPRRLSDGMDNPHLMQSYAPSEGHGIGVSWVQLSLASAISRTTAPRSTVSEKRSAPVYARPSLTNDTKQS